MQTLPSAVQTLRLPVAPALSRMPWIPTLIFALGACLGLAGCNGGTTASAPVMPTAAAPVFTPAGGSFTAAQTVSMTDSTAGATIFYTLDGSTPNSSSAKYTGALSIASTTTVNAVATATGFSASPVSSAAYTIALPAAPTPTFSPSAGTFTSAQTVTMADTAAGASIFYTLDGSTPTVTSTKYTAPISVSTTTTLKALALAPNFSNSAVASGTYTINLPVAATPTFTPVAGTYTSAQTVSIADTTANASVFYTLDGSTPTTSSTRYTAPIAVSSTETINAIVTASGASQSAVGTAAYIIGLPVQSVSVTLSTYDSASLLSPQSSVAFGSAPAGINQLLIDEAQQYQSIEGFGASFTDSSAYLLEQVAQPAQLSSTLNDLFTRSGNGIGLSFMRNPMGGADISRTAYTFDDTSQADPSLTSFSVAHDQSAIIPLIQSAKKLNPQMKVMASPWSPPAWMKTTTTLEGGNLNSTYYTNFASYFIRYLQAYQAVGLLPDYISLQNEPLYATSGYPSMYMDASTQLTVLRDYVLPALSTSGLSTRILLYDHNWDTPAYPRTILLDPVVLASPLVAGTAWHGYGGPVGAQQGIQNEFPAKGQWETEHSGGTFIGNQFISDFNEITLTMRNAGKSYVKWSLALDQNRGPNLSQLGGSFGGCNTCSPIVQVNNTTGAITKTIEYYTLGQFSKFILPGSIRVWSSDTPTVVSAAFINPDATRVLVAFNNSGSSTSFQVQWGTQNFSYTLPAYGAATFVWNGTQTGTPTQIATHQIQGASYSSQTGLEVEQTTDDTGSYDLGYVTDGATIAYKNVNFGTTVSTVNVRVASGGSGGTVEFHLDSPSGTLISTAKLAVTGGYQTWQTVTAPVAGASGVHDLYMVLHGSGGIGNVNWFQFQ